MRGSWRWKERSESRVAAEHRAGLAGIEAEQNQGWRKMAQVGCMRYRCWGDRVRKHKAGWEIG